MTTLYLVRHGESYSDLNGDYTGQQDSMLTEIGYKQAGCVLSYFNGIHIDAIYSSDLARAHETALPISKVHRVPVIKKKELREIYGGQWEGVLFSQIGSLFSEHYDKWENDIAESRCTGGESVREVCVRALGAVEEIVRNHPGQCIVITSHGLLIRTLLTCWLTGDIANMKSVPWAPNASISKIECKDGIFTPVEIGITDHLEGLITSLDGKI